MPPENRKTTESTAVRLREAGNAAYDKNDPEQALDYFKRSLALFKKLNDQTAIAELTLSLGKCYLLLQQDHEAKTALQQARDFYNTFPPIQPHLAITDYYLGFLHADAGSDVKALPFLESAFQYFKKQYDAFYTPNAAYHLTMTHFWLQHIEQVIELANMTLPMYDTNDNTRLIKLHLARGISLSKLDRFEEAASHFSQVLKIPSENDVYYKCAAFHFGCYYYKLKDYVKARDMLLLAQEMTEIMTQNDEEYSNNKIQWYITLAKVYIALEKLSEAESTLRVALTVCEKQNLKNQWLKVAMEMGLLLDAQQKFDQAYDYFEKIYTNCHTEIAYINSELFINATNFLGQYLIFEDRFSEAETYFRKALAGFSQLQDEGGIAACNRGLGVCLNNQNRFTEAEQYLKLACIQLSKLIPKQPSLRSYILDVEQQLGFCYKRQGKYQEAIACLEAVNTLYARDNNYVEQITTMVGLWLGYYELRQFEKADSHAKTILEFYKNLQNREDIEKATNVITRWIGPQQFNIITQATTDLLSEYRENCDLLKAVPQENQHFSPLFSYVPKNSIPQTISPSIATTIDSMCSDEDSGDSEEESSKQQDTPPHSKPNNLSPKQRP